MPALERQPMEVELSMELPSSVNVGRILDCASEVGKRLPVARLMVTAALAARFPGATVITGSRFETSTVDTIRWHCSVGTTRFYVLDRLTLKDIEKIAGQLDKGRRIYILTPEINIGRAKLLIGYSPLATTVAIVSAEDFMGLMIDLLGGYDPAGKRAWFDSILREYNEGEVARDGDLALYVTAPFGAEVGAIPPKSSSSRSPA